MQTRYGTPVAGNEKEVLTGFLDHYRRVFVEICEGLSDDQLRRPMVGSGTSLLGLMKHLAYVEDGWFEEGVANRTSSLPYDPDDPDMDLRVEDDETAADIFDLYQRTCERSREIMREKSLDDALENDGRSADYNVRWVMVHMIEETARHAGHADIIRELLDGRTGTGYED
jgi:uncharacterized damage-inducible protein DinB